MAHIEVPHIPVTSEDTTHLDDGEVEVSKEV